MDIVIHRDMLGTKQHLVKTPNAFKFEDSYGGEAWVVGGISHDRCVEDLALLYDEQLPLVGDHAQQAAFKSLNLCLEDKIPWHFVLSREDFNDRINRLFNTSQDLIRRAEHSGYFNLFLQHKKFLKSLARSCIDLKLLEKHLTESTENPTRRSTLETFRPGTDGFAQKIEYTQESTVTGRLTVERGPRILTLPADSRDVLKSRLPRGKIYSVDFVSLEPRVIKRLTSNDDVPVDIYKHVQALIGDDSLLRSEVKKLIISCIYGASKQRLNSMTKISGVSRVVSIISEYFGLEIINNKLEVLHKESGHISNFFGRPIASSGEDRHTWLSHYAQSTAVDLALDSFFHLTNNLQELDSQILPIAIIHDAILFDVPETADKIFCDFTDKMIQTKLGNFPVSRTVIAGSNNV